MKYQAILLLYKTICFILTTSNKISFIDYEKLSTGSTIHGITADELSGITYNSEENEYYAISDNLVENKGVVVIDFTANEYTLIEGIQIDASNEESVNSMDSESIVFIENPSNASDSNSYFIVCQEGHTQFDAANELYLYSSDGTYIKTITNQLNSKFLINNTDNNRGLEALSVDETQTYLAYSSEYPLKSDQSFCRNCLRISINTFTVDTDDVTFDDEYELRYDLDTFDDDDEDFFSGLSDMTVFRGENGELYGLLLERAVIEGLLTTYFDCRIYVADLSNSADDVKSCYSLSDDDCKDIDAVEKTLLFSFSEDIDIDDTLLATVIEYGNFEILSILYNDDMSVYDENGIINLVAISDNGGETLTPTYFMYLQYNACDILELNDVECTDFALYNNVAVAILMTLLMMLV